MEQELWKLFVTNLTHKKHLRLTQENLVKRFGKICAAFGIDYTEIKNEWDTPVSVEAVVEAVKADSSIDAVFIQICESAGGLRHPC